MGERFSISHFPFPICPKGTGDWCLKENEKWELENDIWKISAKGFQINAHSYFPP